MIINKDIKLIEISNTDTYCKFNGTKQLIKYNFYINNENRGNISLLIYPKYNLTNISIKYNEEENEKISEFYNTKIKDINEKLKNNIKNYYNKSSNENVNKTRRIEMVKDKSNNENVNKIIRMAESGDRRAMLHLSKLYIHKAKESINEKFNDDGYDEDGYDENGFDKDGFDENGYDEDGYNADGYNRFGCHNQF